MSALPLGATIGILGGGQLGRMLSLAASRLGFKTHIYCPDPESPAFEVTPHKTIAAYDDEAALTAFAAAVELRGTAQAWDGLGLACWWLQDPARMFDAKQRAYTGYVAAGDKREAARVVAHPDLRDDLLCVQIPEGGSPQMLWEVAAKENEQIRYLRPQRSTLEEVFLNAVEEKAM